MDYSELIDALQNGDDQLVNKIIKDMRPRLVRFLEIHMSAPRSDAEDCVQLSLERTLEIIQEGRLKNKDRVLSYLISTCRNSYLKEQGKNREVTYHKIPSTEFNDPEQVSSIIDQERKQILQHCLDELKDMYRRVIEYWFDHPDSDAETAADYFGISINNVWTRKHRAIKKLNHCYERESNK
ncbi:MAG: RNA polymerase sigma factor [Balneolaceae bacterium]|nr:RNA polymerase sigma factor [Balneolaceae bacterium]